jgi:hypothetical protein
VIEEDQSSDFQLGEEISAGRNQQEGNINYSKQDCTAAN